MVPSCNRFPIILALIPALLLQVVFAADLSAPTTTIPASYFGLHLHRAGSETPWPNMPVPEWRLWDAHVAWPDLEPHKGDWRFQKLDAYVAMAEQHGTGILLPLALAPPWATARPNDPAAEPGNLDDWRTFVRTVVTRYKGRIQAYEIWNEPNLKQFWTGTTDQMLTLTKEASVIIHSVDPKAIVVSPSPTAGFGIPWLAEFLQKGAGQYVDAVGYHFYQSPHTKLPEDMIVDIEGVQKVMSENGLRSKPLWNTETGWLEPSHFDSDEAAAGVLARAYILAWAAGVQRFYWYAWDNRYVTVKTTRADLTVTPAGDAYKTIQEWLIGAQMVTCGESPDHIWTCFLKRSGKNEWLVWNPQGNRKYRVPKDWRVATVTPLLHEARPLHEPEIDIGPAPVLLKEPS